MPNLFGVVNRILDQPLAKFEKKAAQDDTMCQYSNPDQVAKIRVECDKRGIPANIYRRRGTNQFFQASTGSEISDTGTVDADKKSAGDTIPAP